MPLFKFCPRCSNRLDMKSDGEIERPACNSCGYVYYHNPAPAAGALVFNEGRLLMVKRGHEPYVGKWTIPAGFIEWGEAPEETAVRELKEETNLDVRLDGLFHVYAGDDDPRTRAILILYFADNVGGMLEAGDDAAEAKWFAIDQLPSNEEIAFESHRQAIAKLKDEFPDRFVK